ncbi:hypothetical protein M2138_000640 [Dysgonomonadaceae bacterium PH5-43]|nr:hypothetical protein [Dysgonomonadaceae bacterium PH5-43]
MIKKYLTLIILLLVSVLVAKAQPSATNIPNPVPETVVQSNCWQIYGADNKVVSFGCTGTGDAKGTCEAYGDKAVKFTTGSGWDQQLYLNTALFVEVADPVYYEVYFSYNGTLKSEVPADGVEAVPCVYLGSNAQANRYPVVNIETKNEWTTAKVLIPSDRKEVDLRFKINKPGSVLYVGNIYLVRSAASAFPAAPTPPDLPSGTYSSVYSDAPDYGTLSITWDKSNDVFVENKGAFVDVARKVSIAKGTNKGTVEEPKIEYNYSLLKISNATDYIKAVDKGYNRVHFDVWLNTPIVDDQFDFQIFSNGSANQYHYASKKLSAADASLSSDGWYSFDFNLTDLAVEGWNAGFNDIFKDINAFRLYNRSLDSNLSFYIDNIYFYEETLDIDAAPMPTNISDNPAYSYSVYSDMSGTAADDYMATNKGKSDWKRTADLTDKVAQQEWKVNDSWKKSKFTLNDEGISPSAFGSLFLALRHTRAISGDEMRVRIIQERKEDTDIKISSVEANTWQEINIDLNKEISIEDGNITAIEIIAATSGKLTAAYTTYADNIIFYNSTAPNCKPEATSYDKDDIIPIYGQYVFPDEGVDAKVNGWTNITPHTDSKDKNVSQKITDLYDGSYITIKQNSQTNTLGSANAIHLNVWVAQENTKLTIEINNKEYQIPATDLLMGRWNTVLIPLARFDLGTTDLSKIGCYSEGQNDVAYIDNLYFGSLRVNIGSVAQVGTTKYNTIKAAYDANKNIAGSLNIDIIADSYEPEIIKIDASDSKFTSLNIYPSGGTPRTVIGEEFDANRKGYLFHIVGDFTGRPVVIDGRLDKTGAAQSLILQSKKMQNSADLNAVNGTATIRLENATNVTIRNCKFQGQGTYDRPEHSIYGNGTEINILDNYFEDCMLLEQTTNYANNNKTYASSIITIANAANNTLVPANLTISRNHFYETKPVYAKTNAYRSCILYKADEGKGISITNNVIGGSKRTNGAIDGTWTMGSGENKPSDALSGAMYFIYADLPAAADGESNYVNITGNTIANIEITSFKTGSVVGIGIGQGCVRVEDNQIYELSHIGEGTTTTDFLYGIFSSLAGTSYGKVECANNKISNLNTKFNTKASVSLNAIAAIRFSVNSTNKCSSTVKDNRILLNNDAAYLGEDISYSGIAVYAQPSGGSSASSTIDVYNNIIATTGFKGGANTKFVAGIYNYIADANAIVNNYNNIVYVQPVNAFAGSSIIEGFHIRTTSKKVNVFHNTVYIKNINLDTNVTRGISLEYASDDGKTNIYNNIIVNENASGFTMYATNPTKIIGDLDYNVYFSPGNSYLSTTEKFDHQKFVFWGKGVEKDYHSLFQDPAFATTTISNLTIDNLNELEKNLKPACFLGGKVTDGTKVDIIGATRRNLLPTMGALNTSFSNYWVGTKSTDWSTYANWADGKVPDEDTEIVFAPMTASGGTTVTCENILKLDQNRTVKHIYNDTDYQLDINEKTLTLTGGIWQDRLASQPVNSAMVNASGKKSTIVYNGSGNSNSSNAQHIFPKTFVGDKVNNFVLNNSSDFFVLLQTNLEITNDFAIKNPNVNDSPSSTNVDDLDNFGTHTGGLNAFWYNTTLKFSGDLATGNTPNLSEVSAYSDSDKSAYRPYTGQRIPRHAIYGDKVYNLVSNSSKLVTYHDELTVMNSLTIKESGATSGNFEIAADKLVEVKGTTTNNAGVGGLVIKSRELSATEYGYNEHIFPTLTGVESTQKARPNATFIFAKQEGTEVPATVEMYSPAKKDGNNYQWQFFTVPVKQTAKSYGTELLANAWVRRWAANPVNRNPYFGTPYWIYLEFNEHLTSVAGYDYNTTNKDSDGKGYENYLNPANVKSNNLQGYEMTQFTQSVTSFTGNLTNTDYTLPLEYYDYDEKQPYYKWSADGDVKWSWDPSDENVKEPEYGSDGWYVIGNPYTAAVKISEFDFKGDIEAQVQIYNTGSFSDWDGNTNNESAGGYISVPKAQAGKEGLPDRIPTMQGFSIKRTQKSSTTTSFGLTYKSTSVDKNDSELRSAKEEQPSTLIDLESENSFDRLWIFINPETGKGYDNGWDGDKIMNDKAPSATAQLFTMEDDRRFQVSTMDNLNETYLGIMGGIKDTEYTITFNHNGMDREYIKILLVDLENDKQIDVTESGSKYTFTITDPAELSKRFQIVTTDNNVAIDNVEPIESKLSVYSSGNTVYVNNLLPESGTLYVYDVSGKIVFTQTFEANRIFSVNMNIAPGIYLTRAITGSCSVDNKVILKNRI